MTSFVHKAIFVSNRETGLPQIGCERGYVHVQRLLVHLDARAKDVGVTGRLEVMWM